MLRDAQQDDLLYVVSVAQVAHDTEGRQDEEHDVDTQVEEEREDTPVTVHTALYGQNLKEGGVGNRC